MRQLEVCRGLAMLSGRLAGLDGLPVVLAKRRRTRLSSVAVFVL
jgi:hypothetical protein